MMRIQNKCVMIFLVRILWENLNISCRNQGGRAFGAFASPKFSKHCIAILTFAEIFKQ